MTEPGEETDAKGGGAEWNRRRVVTTVAGLWGAMVVAAGLGFGSRLLLGRNLGAAGLGVFATALAAILFVSRGAAAGVPMFWLEVHGTEGEAARRWYRPSAAVVTLTTLLAVAIGSVWAATAVSSTTRKVFFFLVPLVAVHVLTELLAAQCQLRERFGALAAVRITPTATRFAPAALAMILSLGVVGTARGFSVAAGVVSAVATLALYLMTRGPGEGERPAARRVIGRSWPYAVTGALYLVYYQIDIVLLDALEGARQTGLYAAAVAILAFVHLLPGVVYREYLRHRFHVWAEHDRARLRAVHERGSRLMLQLGIALGVALALGGPVVLVVGFGREFDDAIPALLILALTVPIRFRGASARAVMGTRRNVRRMAAINGVTAAANVALNLVLIPLAGMEGAAIATVLSEAALLAMLSRPAARFAAETPLESPLDEQSAE